MSTSTVLLLLFSVMASVLAFLSVLFVLVHRETRRGQDAMRDAQTRLLSEIVALQKLAAPKPIEVQVYDQYAPDGPVLEDAWAAARDARTTAVVGSYGWTDDEGRRFEVIPAKGMGDELLADIVARKLAKRGRR